MKGYRFTAVIARLRVPTRDGRVLGDPGKKMHRPLPLPVLVALGDCPRGQDNHHPRAKQGGAAGLIEQIEIVENDLVAEGCIFSGKAGRDYVGALRLGLAYMALDADESEMCDLREPDEEAGPLVMIRGWRVMGATLVKEAAWHLPPVTIH